MIKPEVLAPAGKMETLIAAVRGGADAVYLGAQSFSARAGAQNFTKDELSEAVKLCHQRGVRVHLTVNTLLREEELPQALELVEFACSLPVDAVLVQDLGLLYLLRKCCPDLPLHASTQMSIHTPAGVRFCKKIGFERVVLSREMSLSEIAACKKENPQIDLEAFVHGALCMSVSGQCYFSAMLGSRSGNRGQCAQTCRLPFSAPGGTGHDLSLKDLSMISRVSDLTEAGVMSLKIEGRMKRPEYVAAAARACRLAADGEKIPQNLQTDLEQVFSRGGFTTGFPDGRRDSSMFGTRQPEDSQKAKAVFPELHELYKAEYPRVPVSFSLQIKKNFPVTLLAEDENGHRVKVDGPIPEAAKTRAISEERCKEQLCKTGGSPFFVKKISTKIEDGLSVPMKELNALRRQTLEILLDERADFLKIPFQYKLPQKMPHHAGKVSFRAHFPSGEVPQEADCCELVYVPCGVPQETLSALQKRGFRVGIELPRGMFGIEEQLRKELQKAKKIGIPDVFAGTLNAVALAQEEGMRIHGGYSLNVFNMQALDFLEEEGLCDTELSFELSLQQACALGGQLPRGTMVYGRQALMLTRCCPIANGGCPGRKNPWGGCGNPRTLVDRKEIEFPVSCVGACSEIYNSVPLSLLGRQKELSNLDFVSVRFTTETLEEERSIFMHLKEDTPILGALTRGLSYRGVL